MNRAGKKNPDYCRDQAREPPRERRKQRTSKMAGLHLPGRVWLQGSPDPRRVTLRARSPQKCCRLHLQLLHLRRSSPHPDGFCASRSSTNHRHAVERHYIPISKGRGWEEPCPLWWRWRESNPRPAFRPLASTNTTMQAHYRLRHEVWHQREGHALMPNFMAVSKASHQGQVFCS